MSATARAAIRNLDAQIAQQQSAIDQDKAEIAAAEASLSYATADNARYGDLKASTAGGCAQLAGERPCARRPRR